MMIEAEEDWHTPFIAFITDNKALEDKAKHEKRARRSANYVVDGKELFRKVASTSILMKFTKWIKVNAITSVELDKAAQFIEEITHPFKVPNRIITDLGKKFTRFDFWDFCLDNLIDVYYSSVAHPRCNGQVEPASGMVLQSLKSRIFDNASKYTTKSLRECPHIIWSLWMQKSRATSYTPFFLVYGSEVMLPTDVTFGAPRIQYYEEGEAEKIR
ncbi:uncharacterized protein LOC106804348 [Setaria italica]|uniref:uncharacterized protein LOC106804348 n=1 Tax=Setaria italica TaxID=4555 RepID=UPI0003511744|nr:uncharacterized protein LOC106804348 [Setaria italica]